MSLSKQRIALGLLAATGGLGAAALGYQLYRTRKAREYLLFTARDALRAIGMTLRSKHIRNTVLASVILTLLLRRAGVGIRRRHMIPTLFSIIWYLHYRMNIVEHPVVRCKRSFWNQVLVERARLTRSVYRPVIWGWNRHAMTVLCSYGSSLEWSLMPPLRYERESVPSYDGAPVHLDWVANPSGRSPMDPEIHDWPILLLVHGLNGSHDDANARRLARVAQSRGWRAVVNSIWRLDFGQAEDLTYAVNHLHRRFPNAPIAAVGWSAGGHILLRYLEVSGKNTPLVAAVTLSGVHSFPQTYEYVKANENATYRMWMDASLRKVALRHIENDPRPYVDKEALRRAALEETDAPSIYDRFLYHLPWYAGKDGAHNESPGPEHRRRISSPRHTPTTPSGADAGEGGAESLWEGGMDDEEWGEDHSEAVEGESESEDSRRGGGPARVPVYRRDPAAWRFREQTASHYPLAAGEHLHRVGITLLMVHALDDPVVPSTFVDWQRIVESNKNIIAVTTQRGGHCGWFDSSLLLGSTWSERLTADFLGAVLETQAHTNFLAGVIRTAMRQTPRGESDQYTPTQMARICSMSDLAGVLGPDKEGAAAGGRFEGRELRDSPPPGAGTGLPL